MGSWWVTVVLNSGGPAMLVAWIIWVIVAITLHELAHGWAAISRGDDTPIHTGHMTWNPVVHMGLTSLLVFAVAGIAWGAMPVDPSRFRGRYADAWVAFCGPLMNIGLAAFCIIFGGIALALLQSPKVGGGTIDPNIIANLDIFFKVGCILNVALAIFNLLPAPPLDGSRILANFCPPYARLLGSDAGGFLGMALFIVAYLFSKPLLWAAGPSVWFQSTGLIERLMRSIGVL